jgi:subtilisin family serine protease
VRVYQFRHIRARGNCSPRTMALLRRGLPFLLAIAFFAPAPAAASSGSVEVVVGLAPPPLAGAIAGSRVLAATQKAGKLDLASPFAVSYLRFLERAQVQLESRIVRAIPSARVRWRYRVVLDGFAVVVPWASLPGLSRVPGVAAVYPNVAFHATLDTSPELIGADQLWGLPNFTTAGNGIKIGILDQGIDHTHPFFDPAGYVYPAGFPKGNAAYTTPKVIAARAFPPPSARTKYARLPYDPQNSDHGDHVAGIAGGDYTIGAVAGRGPLSGVAPKAYLGNYKIAGALTPNFGLDANAPEIVAGIEAAVRDGMDVINLSFGENEVEPSRDVVVAAMDGAAQAGVVPTIAAGNDFDEFGPGSINSPGNAPAAITVGAATKTDLIASFSSGGPTPISLQLKPDVTAPGVAILSSLPPREGTWGSLSGTSMAAPHAAGGAALLRQRHPDWSVEQMKSALVLTGQPVFSDVGHTKEAPTTLEGGGLIDLPLANNPLIFAEPTSLSFELLRPGQSATRTVSLTDAGGGSGTWQVTVAPQGTVPGAAVSAAASVTVPGTLALTASAGPAAGNADATGFIVLTRGSDMRRIPYWLGLERPRLERPSGSLPETGMYSGNTRGKPSRVSAYRYPENPAGAGVSNHLDGPEEVFRVRLTRPVANFGVAVVSHGRGVNVSPRVVAAGDENRLQGYTALPIAVNPYLSSDGSATPAAAVVLPKPGSYDVVFDTPSPAQAGRFTFRFWIDDTTPPTARLLTPSVRSGGQLVVALADSGSGVDPGSIDASAGGRGTKVVYSAATRQVKIPLPALAPGRYRLVLTVSDRQEQKNSEDVGPILPNTRVFRAPFTVR